jgi:C1A family cysteine protease
MSTTQINGVERKLNWKRQPSDPRDLVLTHGPAMMAMLPPAATTRLRAEPPIRDQKSIGSCTQNAGAAAMGFVYMLATGKPDPLFSRLFGYYRTRVNIEGVSPHEDSGCNVRDVFRAYRQFGLCFEHTWPYDISKFALAPSPSAQTEALMHQALRFYACPTMTSIKKSIVDGWPVIFGFDCFDSLDSPQTAKTGVITMPKYGEGSIGGHCMMIDSYDDHTRMFSGPNSWGTSWGDKGRFHLPYDYWSHGYASDAHTLRQEEIP